MGFKLDNLYKEPVYPKKGVFPELVVNEDYVFQRKVWKHSYHYWYWKNAPHTALNEINDCLKEEKPCEVVIANLTILFWMIKGPNFNYGGFKKVKLSNTSTDWMCQQYAPRGLIEFVDSLRIQLENYEDCLFPKLKELQPSAFDNVEVIYHKLMLLIYDLVLDSFVCETKGDIWTSSNGYSVSADGYGNYSVKEKEIWHDTTRLEISHSSQMFSEAKFKAYMQGRKIIADNVRRIDPSYPADNNTWMYFKTDIYELRNNVYPIYEVALEDQTLEDKRLDVKYTTIIDKAWFWYKCYAMFPMIFLLSFFGGKKLMDRVDDGPAEYKVGKLKLEEKAYRQTIYLNKR